MVVKSTSNRVFGFDLEARSLFVDAGASVSVDGRDMSLSKNLQIDQHRLLSIEEDDGSLPAFEASDAGWMKIVAKDKVLLGGSLSARGAVKAGKHGLTKLRKGRFKIFCARFLCMDCFFAQWREGKIFCGALLQQLS